MFISKIMIKVKVYDYFIINDEHTKKYNNVHFMSLYGVQSAEESGLPLDNINIQMHTLQIIKG